MNLAHKDLNITLFDGEFRSEFDGILRFSTHISYFPEDLFFKTCDLWSAQYYTYSYEEEEIDTIENKVIQEIEKIVLRDKNNSVQQKAQHFPKHRNSCFPNKLLDQLFEAWRYNAYLYKQFASYSSEEKHPYSPYLQGQFDKHLRYFYERNSNSIVLLYKTQTQLHNHFDIQMDFESSDKASMIYDVFGKQISKSIKITNWYFNQYYYKEVENYAKANGFKDDKLLEFQRRMSRNWLIFMNHTYIIPPQYLSFA